MKSRPEFIKHWSEIQAKNCAHYPDSDEQLAIGSPFGQKVGLKRLGIHYEILSPGRRSSWPHAESSEEEFVYVIEGNPQVWINGEIYDLNPGDGVGFPAGTGIAHTFINNSQQDACLLVIGEKLESNKIYYPKNPELKEKRKDWWYDWPEQKMGSHDGLPNTLRAKQKFTDESA